MRLTRSSRRDFGDGAMQADRRRASRLRTRLPVADAGRGLSTSTRDISATGMCVEAIHCGVGERLAIDVGSPDLQVPLHVAAEVVRIESQGVALQLIHSSEPQRVYFSSRVMGLAF